MKKNTLLYILLIVLLLANGFFLVKHFGDKSDHRDRGRTERRGQNNFIARQLDFNESQIQQLKTLKLGHRETMMTYDNDIKVLKNKFFDNISKENVTKSEIDSLATLISEKEKLKDIELFNHFRDIREICDENQKVRFESIVKKAINRDGRRGPKGPPSHGEKPPRRD